MQMAMQKGANAVWFIPGFQIGTQTGGGREAERIRLARVAFPICDMYGLRREFGEPPADLLVVWPDGKQKNPELKLHRSHSVRWIKLVTKPSPLMPSQQALDRANDKFKGNRPLLVSLRQAPSHNPLRNSGRDWFRWATDHGAEILEDASKSDMDVDDIAAHYELSRLNIGTLSGQFHINIYSAHRPYLVLKMLNRHYTETSEEWWLKNKWSIGDQMPWAASHQKMVWNYDDDYLTIEREYQSYMAANG